MQEIENALIVPLIQGILFSAQENELHYYNLGDQEFYPEGYALSQAILPVINAASPNAATNIKNVMVASFPKQGTDKGSNDWDKVYRAIKRAVAEMDGFDCSQIGSIGGRGFCEGDVDAGSDSITSASASGYSLSLVTVIGAAICLLVHVN